MRTPGRARPPSPRSWSPSACSSPCIGIGNGACGRRAAPQAHRCPLFFDGPQVVSVGRRRRSRGTSLIVLGVAGRSSRSACGCCLPAPGSASPCGPWSTTATSPASTAATPTARPPLSWVLGCMLAALAGILIAPILAPRRRAGSPCSSSTPTPPPSSAGCGACPSPSLGALILGLADSYFSLASARHEPARPAGSPTCPRLAPGDPAVRGAAGAPAGPGPTSLTGSGHRSDIPMPSLRKAPRRGVALVVVAVRASGRAARRRPASLGDRGSRSRS